MTTKTPNPMKLKVKPLFHTQITYDNERCKPMILLRNPLFHTQNYATHRTIICNTYKSLTLTLYYVIMCLNVVNVVNVAMNQTN